MFRPTTPTILVSAILILLSFLPTPIVRMTLFAVLGLPFSYTIGLPFPYSDKPWFVSPAGAIVIAITWSFIIYLATCIVRFFSKKENTAEQDAAANP